MAKTNPSAVVKTLSPEYIKWRNKYQNDVTVIIMKHLVEKAMRRHTTSLEELAKEVQYRFNAELNHIAKMALTDVLHTSLRDIWEWEVRNCRPALSSLVVRATGTEQGLPSPGFWKANALPGIPLESKKAIIAHMHKTVFDYFDICRYEHSFTLVPATGSREAFVQHEKELSSNMTL